MLTSFEADIALVEKRGFDDLSKTNVLSRPSIAGGRTISTHGFICPRCGKKNDMIAKRCVLCNCTAPPGAFNLSLALQNSAATSNANKQRITITLFVKRETFDIHPRTTVGQFKKMMRKRIELFANTVRCNDLSCNRMRHVTGHVRTLPEIDSSKYEDQDFAARWLAATRPDSPSGSRRSKSGL